MIKHLRITGIGAVAALAVVCAPIAQAKKDTTAGTTSVCNLAGNAPVHQGDLIALDAPTGSPAERFRSGRGPMKANGNGLANAAANSPALSQCGGLSDTPPADDGGSGGGGNGGGGSDGGGLS